MGRAAGVGGGVNYQKLKKLDGGERWASGALKEKTPSRAAMAQELSNDVEKFLQGGGAIQPCEPAPMKSHTYWRDLELMEASKYRGKPGTLQNLRDRRGRMVFVDFWYGRGDAYIYFIQAGDEKGPVKIGFSRNPDNRIVGLQISNAQTLTIIGLFYGAIAMEAKLHRKFAKARIRGEWFRPTADLIATAEAMYEMYRTGLHIPNFEVFRKWLETKV